MSLNDPKQKRDWNKIAVIVAVIVGAFTIYGVIHESTKTIPNAIDTHIAPSDTNSGKNEVPKSSTKGTPTGTNYTGGSQPATTKQSTIDFSSYLNDTVPNDVAVLVVDSQNRPLNSISSQIGNLYHNNGYTITTSLLSSDFADSKYMKELQSGDQRLLKKLAPFAKYLVIGKYTYSFTKGDYTTFVCNAHFNGTIISCLSEPHITGVDIPVANGFDDKPHAQKGAVEKLIDVFKANYITKKS